MVSEAVDNKTKSKALRICQQYMGGSWTEIDEHQFCIEHISGGLSNLLYACSIDDEKCLRHGEERKVLIRFIDAKVLLRLYGKIIREHAEAVVSDSVIFGLLAEKRLGPQLYGVFSEGRVEEYINSRHLYTYELHKPDISAYCARMMSQFHQLKMPLCKQPSWLYSTMLRYIEDIKVNPKFGSTFMGVNLSDELDNLRNLLSKLNSPVVFCHNDLQEGNILLSTDAPEKWTLLPIDFEYASYNYRGFDIGNHFCEWCYDYSVEKTPYYSAKLDNYPTRAEQLLFIRAYLESDDSASATTNGTSTTATTTTTSGTAAAKSPPPPSTTSDPSNLELIHRDAGDAEMSDRESHILREIEGFALASHFLWSLWAVVQSHISEIKFGYLEYGMDRMSAYQVKKAEFLNHYNFD